jgi:hypothetical protein
MDQWTSAQRELAIKAFYSENTVFEFIITVSIIARFCASARHSRNARSSASPNALCVTKYSATILRAAAVQCV